MENPFFSEYNTPFGVPPFEQINEDHYLPAFEKAIADHSKEIQAIVDQTDIPTFENTMVPMNYSGELLDKISNVFFNLQSASNNEKMQEIARIITPKLTEHSDNISLNPKLFERIKAIYNDIENQSYTVEQKRFIEKKYNDFVRNGANLNNEDQTQLRELNNQLSTLQLQFEENLLAETNENFSMIVENRDELVGLPQSVIDAAAETANAMKMEGKWAFTLQKPSWIPFLQYSENRALREKLYCGYTMRGDNDNEFDNKDIIVKIAQIQTKRSKLLGFDTFAKYAHNENMAKTPETVKEFLLKIWKPALERSKQELKEMQAIVNKSDDKYTIESWDWWNLSEKLRKEKYDLDEAELKPYLELGNVRDGMFWVANQLYGITFAKVENAPKYNADNDVFEVFEADGSHLGVLYLDYHPRSGKSGGAWCTSFRNGSYSPNGDRIHPIVSIVCNFTKPTADAPSLLSWDETETLFHEFGHGLHGLFSNGHYHRTAGDVPLDFVELPSQIMENWAGEPAVLKQYAKHYKTGEVIPDALIAKLVNSGQFNQGFGTVEYVASALLDIEWYSQTQENPITDARLFENQTMGNIGLIDEIVPRYRSTYFGHIFGGGYSAGYYVYLWAAILDSDAFDAFKQSGDLFNKELAAKFREHCLANVGNYDAMVQYKKFRGQEPSEVPLLKKRGLYKQ
ncbi:MAG: M3 family metallopeptidase [Salinivirgaceae bacterium]|nr:M3 family metallopeptidase [Salinivirgaceae bacterium]